MRLRCFQQIFRIFQMFPCQKPPLWGGFVINNFRPRRRQNHARGTDRSRGRPRIRGE